MSAGTVRTLETPDTIKPDVAWIYPMPLPESQKIAGLVSFYNESVDTVVDGILMVPPRGKVG
jgi:uncharacterized protein (DUF427 family)